MNTISSRCGAEHGLISVDQALDHILQHVQPLDTEKLELQNALNRYLAENIYSSINLPLFSQSAVDGYAICAKKRLNRKVNSSSSVKFGPVSRSKYNSRQSRQSEFLLGPKFHLELLQWRVRK